MGNYIRNDPTLFTYGNNLTVRDGFEKRKYIRDKLQIIATFCVNYHREHDTDNNYTLKEILTVENFKSILKIAEVTWGESLTPPIRLDNHLRDICAIFKEEAIYI